MEDTRKNREDVTIIERVRKGDNAAVELLYKAHYPAVFHFVINNNGDADEAAEIYQQAFIILYEKLQHPSFQLQSSAGTFLYAISRNLWLAGLKERRRFTTEGQEDPDSLAMDEEVDFQQVWAREKDFRNMELSLELLGEPCRSLLKAFYAEGLNMEQIAERMGYTNAENAKNQKYKCLQRLKKIFEKSTDKKHATGNGNA